MKTSTKLLIIFFACIPLSLLAHIYLLRQHFLTGMFVQDVDVKLPANVFIGKDLPPFKHLVIEGGIKTVKNGAYFYKSPNKPIAETSKNVLTQWKPSIGISGFANDGQAGYSITEKYKDLIRTKISHDTLFVSFFKEKAVDFSSYQQILFIWTNTLESAKVSCGIYDLHNFSCKELKVSVYDNTELAINQSAINQLNVFGTLGANITIDGGNKIDQLSYGLNYSSSLSIKNNPVKRFKKLGMDEQSKLSFEGNAQQMEKFLPHAK